MSLRGRIATLMVATLVDAGSGQRRRRDRVDSKPVRGQPIHRCRRMCPRCLPVGLERYGFIPCPHRLARREGLSR